MVRELFDRGDRAGTSTEDARCLDGLGTVGPPGTLAPIDLPAVRVHDVPDPYPVVAAVPRVEPVAVHRAPRIRHRPSPRWAGPVAAGEPADPDTKRDPGQVALGLRGADRIGSARRSPSRSRTSSPATSRAPCSATATTWPDRDRLGARSYWTVRQRRTDYRASWPSSGCYRVLARHPTAGECRHAATTG